MIKDYTPLLKQAEDIEIKSNNKKPYSEAIRLLEGNKISRASAILDDLSVIIKLIAIDFDKDKIDYEDLKQLFGAFGQLDTIIDIVEELKNQTLNRDNLSIEDEAKFKSMIKNYKETIRNYYFFEEPVKFAQQYIEQVENHRKKDI